MADLTPRERLQPSLLDRLTDDEPHKKQDSRERRVVSMQKLRACVMRDLSWLLNTGNLSQTQDLVEYPFVENSVLNYGIPDVAGHTISSTDVLAMERQVRQSIVNFEPRILRNKVKVRAVVREDQMDANVLTFEIEGELWAEPFPERIFLRTQVDLETGVVSVANHAG